MPAKAIYRRDAERYRVERRRYYALNRQREIARELERQRKAKLAILRRRAA